MVSGVPESIHQHLDSPTRRHKVRPRHLVPGPSIARTREGSAKVVSWLSPEASLLARSFGRLHHQEDIFRTVSPYPQQLAKMLACPSPGTRVASQKPHGGRI